MTLSKPMTPLRVAIFESDLTQREIAARAGIHESYLSRIVSGLHVGHATRVAIAKALGRQVEDVFPDSADRRAA